MHTWRLGRNLLYLAFGMSLVACGHASIPINIPAASITAKPLPLHVALIATEPFRTARFQQDEDNCTGRVEAVFGAEFSNKFVAALGNVFGKVEIVSSRAAGVGKYDLLIEPGEPYFGYDAHCASASVATSVFGLAGLAVVAGTGVETTLEAQAGLQTLVFDKDGRLILTDNFLAKVKRSFPAVSSARPYLGEAGSEALGDVVREVPQRIASSKKVQEYAATVTGGNNGAPAIDTSTKKDP
jgi:hypothetical protein